MITNILVIGVFGLTSMNHDAGHSTGCIASTLNNATCPENIVAMSTHHIQAFVSFFSVVSSIPFIFLLALLFAILLKVGFIFVKRQDSILTNLAFWRVRHDPERRPIRPRKITRWLSLLENSPSLHRIFITISNLINLCKQKNLRTKNIKLSILKWHSTSSAEWNLMQIALRLPLITKVRPTTFALSTARITL